MTVLNDSMGTIIYTKDVKVARCMPLGDNEAIMGVISDGENGPESEDVITIDRTGIKCRQSLAEWLEITESERPDFMHVMDSYRKLQKDEPTAYISGNSSRAFELYVQGKVMSRSITGVWYAKMGDGVLYKRTRVESLKNLAAKAVGGMFPPQIGGAQLRADVKMIVGLDLFDAVAEEQPLSVEVNVASCTNS